MDEKWVPITLNGKVIGRGAVAQDGNTVLVHGEMILPEPIGGMSIDGQDLETFYDKAPDA